MSVDISKSLLPRILKMQAAEMPAQSLDFYKTKLHDFKQKLIEFSCISLPRYHNTKLDALHDEGLCEKNNADTYKQGLIKIISPYVDSSTLPLSLLLDYVKRKVQEDAPEVCVSTEELTDMINQIANRVPIGILDRKKSTWEDTDPLCL